MEKRGYSENGGDRSHILIYNQEKPYLGLEKGRRYGGGGGLNGGSVSRGGGGGGGGVDYANKEAQTALSRYKTTAQSMSMEYKWPRSDRWEYVSYLSLLL